MTGPGFRTLALACLLACGNNGASSSRTLAPGEPRNAKEKQALEAKASGDDDKGNPSKWGKWRYTGDRNECFYVFGKRCFKTENAACQAARCKTPAKCDSEGAGPAVISCVGGEAPKKKQ